MARAKRQTPEEVSAERARIAEANWKLAFPSVPKRSFASDHFLAVGNVPEDQLATIARLAEAAVPRVRTALKLPRKAPLVKGKTTIFVVPGRYDYSEFGTMVQQREVPPEERVAGRYSVVDAYFVIRPPSANEEDAEDALRKLVARGVGEVAVEAFGGAPWWFRRGLSILAAGKASKDTKGLKMLARQGAQVLAAMPRSRTLLRGEIGPRESDAACYVVAEMIVGSSRSYRKLISAIRDGAEFESAFAAAYGKKPEAWLDAMLGKNRKNPRR